MLVELTDVGFGVFDYREQAGRIDVERTGRLAGRLSMDKPYDIRTLRQDVVLLRRARAKGRPPEPDVLLILALPDWSEYMPSIWAADDFRVPFKLIKQERLFEL